MPIEKSAAVVVMWAASSSSSQAWDLWKLSRRGFEAIFVYESRML
ncbi:MAG: hypothetical protein ABI180_14935 [Microcoleus sp.]